MSCRVIFLWPFSTSNITWQLLDLRIKCYLIFLWWIALGYLKWFFIWYFFLWETGQIILVQVKYFYSETYFTSYACNYICNLHQSRIQEHIRLLIIFIGKLIIYMYAIYSFWCRSYCHQHPCFADDFEDFFLKILISMCR